jgi:hypothetical protein
MIFSEMHKLCFIDYDHIDFYSVQLLRLKPDCYLKSLIYTLGICSDARRRFDSIYNVKERRIVPDALHAGWQTGGSLKVTRLAFQLFTDTTRSAFLGLDAPDVDECKKYCVSDIFCCSYAPYFVEAIKLRYPEYMKDCVEPYF